MADTIRILYVDDDRDLLDVGKLFLEETPGFSVTCAMSGKEAFDRIATGQYDAIVSDYQMPGMDGITLLKRVRAEHWPHPFILFTGKGREEVVIEALNSGADFYLQKGGDPESQFAELSHKIRQAVLQRRSETIIHDHERREADILNFLPDATFAIDTHGVVIAWNRAIEEMTGVPALEMLGRGNYEYAIPFYGSRRPILIDLVFSPKHEIREKYAFVRAEGNNLTAETGDAMLRGKGVILWGKAVPLTDTKGNIIGAIESIRDISENRRAGEEIACKNIILSTQQETSPDGILIVDDAGKILNYNKKFSEIWRVPKDLLEAGRDEPVLQCVTEQLAMPEAFLARVRHLYESKDEKSYEEILLRDGRVLERFSAPMLGENAKYYGRVWYFRDITERKRADDTIMESEARFSTLYANMIEGVAIHELTFDDQGQPEDYIILDANPAFERHLGISRESVLNKTSRVAYQVDDSPYLEIYARVVLTGKPEVFETYFPPLGRHFSISACCMAPNRFATIFEDISKRKRVEAALQESEEKYRLAAEKTELLIYDYDIPSGKIQWSGAIEQVTGFTGEEFPAKDIRQWETLVHQEDRPAILAELAAAIRRAGNFCVEYRFQKKDGHYIPMESYGGFITDDSGCAYRMIGTQKDIAQKRQMEADLRASEERYRTYIDNSPEGIFIVDDQGRYTDVNPAACSLLGYSREELLSFTIGDVVPAERRSAPFPLFNKLKEEGHLTAETVLVTKSKKKVPVLLNAIRLPGDRYMSFCTDISERKRVEQDLASAHEKLSLLSGITRHDIANQITLLQGYRRMVEKRAPGPEILEYCRKIDSAAQRIASMIRFAKEYEILGATEPFWQDCRLLIEEAVREVSIGGIQVKNEIPQGMEILADPLIERVFFNLLDNAARHGGKITMVRFALHEAGKNSIIICEDDGNGIARDEKESIFERGVGRNTGLGLFLVREILNITGIAIVETGEQGEGARFEIRVPDQAFRRLTGP